MTDTLDLQIVTPTGIALKRQVTELTGPSVAGEFGVLPGHLPLLAAMRMGVVTYKATSAGGGTEEGRVGVAHGFAQVVNDKALLLTEKFARKEDVDPVAVHSRQPEVARLLEQFSGEPNSEERRALIEEAQWLAVLGELLGDPPEPIVREDTRLRDRAEEKIILEGVNEDAAGSSPTTGDNH